MKKMQDYTRDYKPDFQFSDLSKDALIRLLENYQRIFVGVCGIVYTVLREEMGNKEALRLWPDIYDKQVEQFEIPLVREAMNIQGDDVVAMMKYFQTCPDGCRKGMYVYNCDIKNKNHAILTFTYCRSLFYFERHNDAQGIETMCGPGGFEERAFKAICKAFNPDMKCRALQLPPRKSKDAICCVWEFKVEPKTP
jgi:hypothetical protein